MKKQKTKRRSKKTTHRVIPYLVFPVALILPAMALVKIVEHIDIVYVTGYLVVVSLLTIYSYWSDKRKAEANLLRTPESTLFLLELMGGWAAGFFSQRIFRHKISKEEYQSLFWSIAVIHQYLAFDYLHQWNYTTKVFQFIEPILK